MPKRLNLQTKEKLKELRRTGHSIPEMSKLCSVPKSTALRYANMTPIAPEYIARWQERRNASKIMLERKLEESTNFAFSNVNHLDLEKQLIILSCLYWAEGAKMDCNLTNSDARLISVFLAALRNVFNLSNADIIVNIRVYSDLNIDESLSYWSKATGKELTRDNTSVCILEGKKTGKLPYGMCRVRVRKGGLIHKKINAINKRIFDLCTTNVPS